MCATPAKLSRCASRDGVLCYGVETHWAGLSTLRPFWVEVTRMLHATLTQAVPVRCARARAQSLCLRLACLGGFGLARPDLRPARVAAQLCRGEGTLRSSKPERDGNAWLFERRLNHHDLRRTVTSSDVGGIRRGGAAPRHGDGDGTAGHGLSVSRGSAFLMMLCRERPRGQGIHPPPPSMGRGSDIARARRLAARDARGGHM